MSVEQCVSEGLTSLLKNRSKIVPGRLNRILNALVPLREVVVLYSSAQAMEPHQGDLPFAGARSGPARVICGLSGGVDSAVAAGLIHEAIADRLTCALDLRSHFLTKLIRRLNLRLDALNAQPIARVEVRCIRAEAASPFFLAALALKKNDPGNSGVIFHQGLVVSCRLVAFERPHGRLATLPAA